MQKYIRLFFKFKKLKILESKIIKKHDTEPVTEKISEF